MLYRKYAPLLLAIPPLQLFLASTSYQHNSGCTPPRPSPCGPASIYKASTFSICHATILHAFHSRRLRSQYLPHSPPRPLLTVFLPQSYVGGLYLDQGLAPVEKWLKLLFKPYATEAYIRVRTQHGLPPLPAPVSPPVSTSTSDSSSSSDSSSTADTTPYILESDRSKKSTSVTLALVHRNPYLRPHASGTPNTTGHLALFNQQLQKARREVEWVYDDCVAEGTTTTPIWAVRVEVDGEVFGRGRGGTKKAARNEAAKEGLVRMGIVV